MAKLNSGTQIYGNLIVNTFVTAVGNVIAGNVTTVGLISATGNVTAGNVVAAGNLFYSGNILVARSLLVGTRTTVATIPLGAGGNVTILTRTGNTNVVVST